jgi:hypothetical protein
MIDMRQVQLAVRLDGRVKRAVDQVCRGRGLSLSRFVTDALLDKLEELADVEDIKRLRHEPKRPLADVIRDLGLDGEIPG